MLQIKVIVAEYVVLNANDINVISDTLQNNMTSNNNIVCVVCDIFFFYKTTMVSKVDDAHYLYLYFFTLRLIVPVILM